MTDPVRLEDYRPFDFDLESTILEFDLDPSATRVRSKLAFRRRAGAAPDAPLRLEGFGLKTLSVRLDGAPLDVAAYEIGEDCLVVRSVPDRFELESEVEIDPSANTRKKGMFHHVGKLISHCEPEGFRAITWHPDRPDVLSRYRVTLRADQRAFPVLLSNGDLVDRGEADGRHWATFDDPFPKPTYIFAVMAGDFGVLSDRYVTRSGREIALNIHAEPGEEPRCAFAMESLKAALAWDERVFGLEYDLAAYNIVALNDYAGAQENKGLNLFGADGIVADAAITTDEEFALIRRIIGHESFHNWTGNRVTCRDWFQLSLKEGLTRLRDQLFMEDELGGGWYRIEQVKALRRNQFPEDDGPAAHPIQPQTYLKIDNFYTNTVYDKGAEVHRMLRALLGPEGFAAALRHYLETHDGAAATLEDFIAAVSRSSGADLTQFRKWMTQAGRPRLTARSAHDPATKTFRLTLSQTSPDKPGPGGPMHMPVGVALFSPNGEKLQSRLLELREAEQTFVFDGVAAAPVPSILRGFTAPVSLDAGLSDAALAHLVQHDDDPFVAWDSLQTVLVRQIRRLAASWRAGEGMSAPDLVLEAIGGVLRDPGRDAALKALLLGVPDEPVLSEGLDQIDLSAHFAARDFVRAEIGRTQAPLLRAAYESLSRLDPASQAGPDVSGRMLRNACLDLLAATGDPEALDLCLAQVREGPTITERFEALSILSHHDTPRRAQAMADFLARYEDQPLVVDKWFKVMALARAPGVLDEIIALEGHPKFDTNNTARMLAYYGSFFRQNRRTFHDPGGRGYAFLASTLLRMDGRGAGRPGYYMPQIDQWRRYDPGRQALMQAALRSVLDAPAASPLLRETVSRTLYGDTA